MESLADTNASFIPHIRSKLVSLYAPGALTHAVTAHVLVRFNNVMHAPAPPLGHHFHYH